MKGPTNTPPAVVLAATVLAAMLVVANVSVLNVALPELSVELSASQAQSQWMVDIYAVVLASLLLPTGALGDRFGRRLILLVGLVILLVANLVTLALDTANQVIVARAFSGVGAAFVFPATLSTITATLPDDRRSRGVAIWTAAVAVGGFFGILGSGVLIESFWWGSLFLAMAIATAVVLIFCAIAVPDSSDPAEANLDPLGALLSIAAFGGLVLGIIEGPVEGWTSTLSAGGLIVGGLALVAFVAWEATTARPLLDVRLFRQRGIRAGSLSVFTQFVGAFGIFFIVVFYLGVVLGYGALDIGLSLIPIAIGLLPASIVAIPLANRYGRRAVGTVGLLIMGVGFAYGTTIGVDSGLRHFLIAVIVMGVGYGMAGPPATEAIVESLPPAQQGVASALNDVVRELGAAIGIAIAGSAFNSAYRSSISDLDGYPEGALDVVRESPFAVAAVVPDLGDLGPALVRDVQEAAIEGWALGLWTLVAAMVVGAAGFAAWAPGRATARGEPKVVLDPDDMWIPGPLGAIELAASAEAELIRVAGHLDELDHQLELLELRSVIPKEMASWSASQQVEVAERAAIAMAAPLEDLRAAAERVLAGMRGCDRSVSAARAEIVRLSQSRDRLHVMELLVSDVAQQCTATAAQCDRLARRFDDLSRLFSTLRPAAEQVRSCRAIVGRCEALGTTWSEAARPDAVDLRQRSTKLSARPGASHGIDTS